MIYESDAYRREVVARVVRAGADDRGAYVVLDRSVLYPEGGGQPADRGRIDAVGVVDVQRVEREPRHYLDGAGEEIAEGDEVEVTVDWARRYDHMQQHTAQHLITALAADRLGWETTSFHLGSERSDIELDVERPEPSELERLERLVAEEIRAARRVRARHVPADEYERLEVRTRGLPEGHEGRIRLVEIEEIDLAACGGTHLSSTAEIETVKLLDSESLRGGTRLYWVAGGRVRRLLGGHERRARELRRIFQTADEEIVGLAESKLEELTEAARRIRSLEKELADAIAERLAARPERVVAACLDADGAELLQRVARAFSERAGDRVALLTTAERGEGLFVIVAGGDAGIDLAEVGPRVTSGLDARGGGHGTIFQGKAARLEGAEEVLEILRREIG